MSDPTAGPLDRDPAAHPLDRLRRELSLRDAIFLVVASVIGSGIFLTPGTIADRLPHAGLIFAAWMVGGLLSLAGALANAELGAMFPRAGGDYVYLREAFHPLAGFLVGWLSFVSIFAGTVAALGVGFGEALCAMMGWSRELAVPIGIASIAASSLLNFRGVRHGAVVNNVTAWFKIIALLAFGIIAPFTGAGDLANLRPLARGALDAAPPLAFVLALSPVLFSYLGWNASVFVASEIRDPGRNVPRSLFIGLAICTGVYLVVNAVYLYALPIAELRQTANAGEAAAAALFGELGGRLVAGFVLVSILGTLNATVLVGPRIAYAMALDGLFNRGAASVHEGYRTPGGAIAVQAGVAIGLVALLQSFPSALDYTTFAILLATIADTAALFALRRTQPERHRPYRAWGFPWVPGLYLVANAGIALGLAIGRPTEAIYGLIFLAAGLPVYALLRRAG